MGVTCCSPGTCRPGTNDRIIKPRAFDAKVLNTELRDFCTYVSGFYANLDEALTPLGNDETSMVKREAFKRFAEKLGFPGDAGVVFDSLDSQNNGALQLHELRTLLMEAMTTSSQASSSGRRGSKQMKKKPEGKASKSDRSSGQQSDREKGRKGGSKQVCEEPSSFDSPDASKLSGSLGKSDMSDLQKGPGRITQESTRSSLHDGARAGSQLSSVESDAPVRQNTEEAGPVNARKVSKGRKNSKQLSDRGSDGEGKGGKKQKGKEDNKLTEPLLQSDGQAAGGLMQSLLTVPAALGTPATIGSPKLPQREGSEALPAGCDSSRPASIRAPTALADVDSFGSARTDDSSFVLFRPHPYQKCDDDDVGVRTFVYRGRLLEVPLLPLAVLDEDRKGESDQASKGKGWQMVKSKVVGQMPPP